MGLWRISLRIWTRLQYTRVEDYRKVQLALVKLLKELNNSDPDLKLFIDNLFKRLGTDKEKLLVQPLQGDFRQSVVDVIKQAEPLQGASDSFGLLMPHENRAILV